MTLRIAWLEQSGEIQPEKSELVEHLGSFGVDYYRLNWKHGHADELANVFAATRVSWSMGRGLLIKHARQADYDYYIVVDDDISFDQPLDEALPVLKQSLELYSPLLMSVRSGNWQEKYINKLPSVFKENVAPVFITDLQLQIYSRAAVDQYVLPIRYDGGWGTMWYIPLLIDRDFKKRALICNSLSITNGNKTVTGEYGGVTNKADKEIWERDRELMRFGVKKMGNMMSHHRVIKLLNFLYGLKKL